MVPQIPEILERTDVCGARPDRRETVRCGKITLPGTRQQIWTTGKHDCAPRRPVDERQH